ncbi:hypothetical protein JAAARDRAFT_195506 [Jaapia argillacea MUCL 33604]|uniref:Uncharacterized protein n=1 Tax=Jaapia argillacea MUCL 33604 TaxID=933084 RepID=A0A067PLI7_9AGAM|nr:hypothetical protein JAAARDRAFT_195506 [Jaapia argillacea MUCL 33604]
MPQFPSWSSGCGSTQITFNDYPLHQFTQGISIPTWAYINLTPNNTFDVDAALTKSRGWTTAQIVTPIIVGTVLIVIFSLFLYWYHRSHKTKIRRKRTRSSISGTVQTKSPSFFTNLFSSTSKTKAGPQHYRLESWTLGELGELEEEQTAMMSRTSSSDAKKPGQEAFGLGMVNGPGRYSPYPVVSLPPRQGFRIDDTDLSTQYPSRSSTMDAQPSSTGAVDTHDLAREAVIREEQEGQEGSGDDERSVLLISRVPGVDFSISDATSIRSSKSLGVEIVPPSPTRLVDILNLPPTPPTPSHPPLHIPPHSPSTTYTPLSITPPTQPPQAGPSSPSRGSLHVLTPSSPSRTYTPLPPPSPTEFLARPSRSDPSLLIPAAVRAAGYNPYQHHPQQSTHTLNVGHTPRTTTGSGSQWTRTGSFETMDRYPGQTPTPPGELADAGMKDWDES